MAVYLQAQCIRKATCELCDKDTNVDFKCVNCQQILCFDCKSVHLRSKASIDHEIKSISTFNGGRSEDTKIKPISTFISGRSEDTKMANGTDEQNGYDQNMTNNSCRLHPKRSVNLYCQDCSQAICKRCIITSHKDHNFCNLNEVKEEMMAQLREELANIQNSKVADLEERENVLNTLHAKLDASEKSTIRDIKQASKRLQTRVTQWEQSLLKKVAERSSQEKKKLWENKELICDELSNLDELQSEYMLALASNDVHEILRVINQSKEIKINSNISEIVDSGTLEFAFVDGTALKGDTHISFGHVKFPGDEKQTRHYREPVPTSPTVLTHPLSIATTYEQAKTAF